MQDIRTNFFATLKLTRLVWRRRAAQKQQKHLSLSLPHKTTQAWETQQKLQLYFFNTV